MTLSCGVTASEELMYTDSSTINVNSYSGYEVLNIAPNSPLSSPQFNLAQYAGAISMSGLEMLQNSGEEAFIDLMEGRFKVTEAQLANRIDYDLYQDGKHTSAVFKVGEMLETPARLVVRRQSVTIH